MGKETKEAETKNRRLNYNKANNADRPRGFINKKKLKRSELIANSERLKRMRKFKKELTKDMKKQQAQAKLTPNPTGSKAISNERFFNNKNVPDNQETNSNAKKSKLSAYKKAQIEFENKKNEKQRQLEVCILY